MEKRALQITLALVLVLPFTAALAGVTAGPRFLGHPPAVPVDLDSHFRYVSGIFLAMLLLYVGCIPGIERKGRRLRLLAFLTIVGGSSRLVSLATAGVPSPGHQVGLAIELAIAPAIVLWQARVARRFGVSRPEGALPALSGDRAGRPRLGLTTLLVDDYDRAITFFVDMLGFALCEDRRLTTDRRWVVVRPPGGETGLLLARAADDRQRRAIGGQGGGRVFLFLETDDFIRDHRLYTERGVRFVEAPRHEPYGIVAVFEDIYGNRWDLIQPAALGERPPL